MFGVSITSPAPRSRDGCGELVEGWRRFEHGVLPQSPWATSAQPNFVLVSLI